MTTPTEKYLTEKSLEYSFNINSELFHTLDVEQQKLWKKETEQHFCDGFNHAIDYITNDILKTR